MAPTSPLAAADAGPDFETDIGAVYLVALLLGGSARGATDGGVAQVTFQQASMGAPLDDLIIETEVIPDGRLRLDLQVKRTFTFAPGDREFASVLEKSWDTFRAFGLRDQGHRFGVALGHFPAKLKEHYVRVPVWAITSPSAEHFFDRIAKDGLSSKEMRSFVENLSNHLRRYAPSEATLPFEPESLPVERECLPVERESFPVERESLPVERESVPVERKSFPVERKSLPVERESFPVERESLPVERECLPVERECLPVEPEWACLR